ncbi:ectoine/hydroxyectoine ABC transporter substrate-binding protein EhuB [Desulfosporosinus meridiei]|uniref:Amino acid ABC transporter substrate-binding protein, PAAT family n=1 Tax=Desulfosporosinus meridiei (strain ATCC BAA-275 / DSM 13257 / KCTC 12902 / NCIMB 13706 / S10) TaxID=768704 RepID=J7J2N0_DESMD|nr:ectoine/hydroxyectoine ABC transporter substrate-binding protein EhuB [Desulfosporosinus meridiei]AFQ45231.1 amino acid ABC transporter substrate-binding protein, PAAT family [Desulfosporosinus meridiei DSM 13257]
MKKRSVILTTLSVFILAVSLVGCGSAAKSDNPAPKEASTLEKAKQQGYITVGFANEAPYAYATPDGKLTGEAVEVSRAILKKLGINEMNGVLTEFGSLIPGLNANRFDMITAGMWINADRAKQVNFANPDYQIGEGIAVKAGNPLNLHSYEDIAANAQVKVGAMSGSAEIKELTAIGVKDSQIVSVPDQPSALAALQSGRVNVITMSGPALQSVLDTAKDSGIERVKEFTQPVIDGKSVVGYGAAVLRKADVDFLEAYNKELAAMEKSGELLEIIKPFGFTEENLPGGITVEQVLAK